MTDLLALSVICGVTSTSRTRLDPVDIGRMLDIPLCDALALCDRLSAAGHVEYRDGIRPTPLGRQTVAWAAMTKGEVR